MSRKRLRSLARAGAAVSALAALSLLLGTLAADAHDPSTVAAVTFTQQPAQTKVGATIDASTVPAGVRVELTDAHDNPVSGATVTIAIDRNPGGGTLAGTLSRTSDASGIATFSDLSIGALGVGYTLRATTGAVSATSVPFVIATSVSSCSVVCHVSASSSNSTTVIVDSTGTRSGQQLGIALLASSAPPSAACPGFTPRGDGSFISFDTTAGSTPSLRVTWTLDKAVVKHELERGAGHFDICLGAASLDPTTTTGYPTQDGSPAAPFVDTVFGVRRYWGLLPGCAEGTLTAPCIHSRIKGRSGDVIVVIDVPYPWDPAIWGG
jgi:hypothetical protein